MKVILAADVDRLGQMGDLIDVANGYARNFLLPKKLAAMATVKNVKILEHEKRLIADQIRKQKHSAEDTAKKIGELSLTIGAKVGEEGKLFGSIASKEIVDALAKEGVEIDKRKILLEKPIKEMGSYQVPVKIHHDVTAQVKVEVVPKTEE